MSKRKITRGWDDEEVVPPEQAVNFVDAEGNEFRVRHVDGGIEINVSAAGTKRTVVAPMAGNVVQIIAVDRGWDRK